jgi:DNA-binding NarL/FixJ family response regulator
MGSSKTHSIHICDDHALITFGVSLILKELDFVETLSLSHTKEELFKVLSKQHIDLLLLDLSVHGINMLDELPLLKEKYPTLKIILLTSYASIDVQREALQKKVNGFLSKDTSNEHIIEACRSVLKGENYWLSEKTLLQVEKTDRVIDLTPREKEILKLLVKGYTNQKIADALVLSIHTVQTHRKNLKSKLQLEGVSDLVSFAYHYKLV